MRPEHGIDPIAIDVSRVLRRSVASLYSHLVTRPTGRAVRLAIESQLGGTERASLSLIDLSEVTILDFSCADEVVAKLLARFLEEDRPSEAFFVFRCVSDGHLHPIETVLRRQSLVAVAEWDQEFKLIGVPDGSEGDVWTRLEERGVLTVEEVDVVFPDPEDRDALERLVRKRVAFRTLEGGTIIALSTLIRDLL